MAENNVVRFDGQPERRRTRRYALEQEVRYLVSYRDPLSQTGIGWLINISLSGILFKSERTIFPGAPLTVVMNCAGLLDQTSPIELMIQGRVVRSNEEGTASTIDRYEFRSEGRAAKSCRLGTILVLSAAPRVSGVIAPPSKTASGRLITSPGVKQA